jgi:putative membrane protein
MAFLTDEDRQKIASAITEAERRTSGELVAVVAQAADDYRYVPLLWPALAALLLPALLLTIEPGMGAWPLYLVQAAAFIVLALLAHLPPVRMALVPASIKRRRAGRLAREQFFRQGLHLTRARTGVLIFVSVAEHYVEIIADEGINAVVPPGTWEKAVADFVERVRAGRIAEGFLAMIDAVGTRLSEHFPRAADDRDELPNRLIEIEDPPHLGAA